MARDDATEGGLRRGLALRGAGGVAHPLVAANGAGVARSDDNYDEAAAGVRATTGLMLQRASGLVFALGMLYGKLRTRRARRGDQMVTGATPAVSSAEVSFGLNGGGGYEAKMTRGREGNRPEAHMVA